MSFDFRYESVDTLDVERLYKDNPHLSASYEDYCPTCLKKGSYKWKDVVHECDCHLQLQMHKHYLAAGIGDTYQRLSWDDFHGDQLGKDQCSRYLKNHEQYVSRGIGILFSGTYGSGKTMATNLLLKDLMHVGYSVFATTFTAMIDLFTAGWYDAGEKDYFRRKLRSSQIVLIDDIGKEFNTKNNLAESTFDSVLRTRVQNAKPTFITTNMSASEMEKGYGSAIFSLLREAALDHRFEGIDYRNVVGNRKLDEIDNGETRPIV